LQVSAARQQGCVQGGMSLRRPYGFPG
jgi:hypothetical protein